MSDKKAGENINIVQFKKKESKDLLSPNNLLDSAKSIEWDSVLVVGYSKDGGLDAFSTNDLTHERIVFLLRYFEHRILSGDYWTDEQ